VNSDAIAPPIVETLQSVIYVQPPRAGSLLERPEFLARCRLMTPNWREQPIDRLFVDGFVGKCYSNSWKVYRDALEDGLRLCAGYAFARGAWWEHAWCLLGDRIVESTHSYLIYFGAELTSDECTLIGRRFGVSYPPTPDRVRVYTILDGLRRAVPYDPQLHAAGIGRERDTATGDIVEGLGRR
jgi:hypothetical protein